METITGPGGETGFYLFAVGCLAVMGVVFFWGLWRDMR